jgi:hypothetical protein
MRRKIIELGGKEDKRAVQIFVRMKWDLELWRVLRLFRL